MTRIAAVSSALIFVVATSNLAAVASAQTPAPAARAAAPAPAPPSAARVSAEVWPRHIGLSGAAVLVYQPQVTGWVDNRMDFRSAAAIRSAGAKEESYGVIEASARTVVDKVSRTVGLVDLQITKSDFPALPGRGASYAAELQKQIAPGVRNLSLDQLTRSLTAGGMKSAAVAVDNKPPRVIVSETPAILVPIDGTPSWQPVAGGGGFQRVLNTRALIVKRDTGPMFIKVFDGWLTATSIEGPWTRGQTLPPGADAKARQIAATGVVDLLDGGANANPRPTLAQGVPVIYTSQVPAELVVFKGKPDFAPIVGTGLLWATNTTSDVLRVGNGGDYHALLAGRWFRASALTGPWTFVASNALPADFAKIPPTSLAGAVLPAVAGTQQAKEAMIANLIPQTATVPRRNGPTFTARFDGEPQLAPLSGTNLAYVQNSAVPIIRTAPDAFYALKVGIWFTASQLNGPWTVAASVPASIYAMPPTSPLFYVTYARVFGATLEVVYMGYTQGYLGAVTTTDGTVVYGTGYNYSSWIGKAWFPAPATYGLAAVPVFNPGVGYTYAFAMGLGTVDWTQPIYGGARFHPAYWGGYPCCGSASANVYLAWRARPKAGDAPAANVQQAGNAQQAGSASAPSAAAASAPAGNAPAGATLPAGAINQALANPGPQYSTYVSNASRGYDMSMVSSQDSPNRGANAAPDSSAGPKYISANAYYASLGKSGAWQPDAVANNTYAHSDGSVYRQANNGWQQHGASGWTNSPAPPPAVDAQAQARAQDSAVQLASFGMSNATRFTQQQGDGWSARDSGSGGYSRTLGGSGGISAEYRAYQDSVQNAEWDIAAYGGVCGNGVCISNGGYGWGGRYGGY